MNLIPRLTSRSGKTAAAKRPGLFGLSGLFGHRQPRWWRSLFLLSVLTLALIATATAVTSGQSGQSPTTAAAVGQSSASRSQTPPESLSATEFSRLIRELSEEGGSFRSDNFTSNETSYLHVVDKLKQLGATGGAYIGVGPEQNFTYIAKIRPRIAIIVDIRRQAIIQHLMYKAIFLLSPTRAQFLARLVSKPWPKEPKEPKENAPGADAPINDILAFCDKIQANDQTYAANLAEIRKAIEKDFQFPLSEGDQAGLEYIYKSFRNDGLEIAYRMGGYRGSDFPTLGDIIVQPDQNGKLGNFLVSKDDYEFVRELHRKNLIIPVVGDFGGKKALAAVGDYLRKNGYTVTAFYTSNVEQYLFDGDLFASFANNVRKLPLTDKSLFIRAAFNMRFPHPAKLPTHRSATLLQQMTVFLKDFDAGLYPSYSDLVMTHYIAP